MGYTEAEAAMINGPRSGMSYGQGLGPGNCQTPEDLERETKMREQQIAAHAIFEAKQIRAAALDAAIRMCGPDAQPINVVRAAQSFEKYLKGDLTDGS